jgi:UDP-3-O-[3-hydroxymyristoyl] glucosamine N-acyltransferase
MADVLVTSIPPEQIPLLLKNISDQVAYAVANMGSGGSGGSIDNALIANTTSGEIINSATNEVVSYLYQYINVRYADTIDGSVNFSLTPTNRQYFGIRDTVTPAGSENPTDYTWYQATGGFGTTKFLYYSCIGGRQITFQVGTDPSSSSFLLAPINLAIDLDIVTSSNSSSIITTSATIRSVNTPATPTGGSYNFATLTLNAPAGWSNTVPDGTDPIWSSQNTFVSPSTGNTAPPAKAWSTPVIVSENGTSGVSTYNLIAYTRADNAPTTPTANTGSWNFTSATGTPPTGVDATWSLVPPTGNIQLWGSSTVASIIGTQGTANNLTWSTPYEVSSAGAPGVDGVSIFYYTVFQQSPTQPTRPGASGSFNFSTTTGTPPTGWTNSVPTGNIIVWASSAQATSPTAGGIWLAGPDSWNAPIQWTGTSGTPGTDGENGWTANCYPSLINYVMNNNGSFTANSTPINVSFTNGDITDTAIVFGNVSSTGTISYAYGNISPNISIIGPTSTSTKSVTIGFRHTSNSTATAITTTQTFPYTAATGLGGANILVDGNTVATVAAAPVLTTKYSNGQFFVQNNSNTWTPTPVANIITTSGNITVTRGNLIVGRITRDIGYNVISKNWTITSNTTGEINPSFFAVGTPQATTNSFYNPIQYTDILGTTDGSIAISIVQAGAPGNIGPAGNRGFIPMAAVVTSSDPTTFTSAQFTTAWSAPRANTVPPIGTGYPPIAGDTGTFTYTYPANGRVITVAETFNGNTWTLANAQVVSGNMIVTGSINSTALNANDIYALNIQSTNANIGNNQSNGFWLQSSTGNARFGGAVNIGNSLTVGNNANIGNLLTVGSNANIGGNLRVGNSANIGALLTVGTNANIGASATIGANLSVGQNLTVGTNANIGNNAQIGGNLTVVGLINGSVLNANTVGSTQLAANSVVAGKIAVGAITANIISANTINGNAIIANTFAANTINGNAIIANTLTIGNINSFGSTVGDVAATGYWLRYDTGSARFGGSLSIGNNASIGNNLTIGGNLSVSGLVTSGNLNTNTVGSAQLRPGTIPGLPVGVITVPNTGTFTLTTNTGTWDGIGPAGYQKILAYDRITAAPNWISGAATPRFQVNFEGRFNASGYNGSAIQMIFYLNPPATLGNTSLTTGSQNIRVDSTSFPFSGSYNGYYNFSANVLVTSGLWSSSYPDTIGWAIVASNGITNVGNIIVSDVKAAVTLLQG